MDTNTTAQGVNLISNNQNDSTQASKDSSLNDSNLSSPTDVNNISSISDQTPLESSVGVGVELPSENENIVKNQQEVPTVDTLQSVSSSTAESTSQLGVNSPVDNSSLNSVNNTVSSTDQMPVAENTAATKKSNLAPIFLIILFYPMGVFYMWFATKWSVIVKIIVTLPLVLAIVLLAITTITPSA